ncbi:MAG: tRNA lysidine(34) synthetase TilS [Myxococcales bacterium]
MLARMTARPRQLPSRGDAVEGAVARACAGPEPLLPQGATVLVACSGGADSVALAAAAATVGRASKRFSVAFGHVDHGLRPAAGSEAEGVRRLAQQLGVPFFLRRLTGLSGDLADLGLEGAAREARYDALASLCAEAGAQRIATAHTRSDQAETLLLRLARGAGPGALAGVRRTRRMGSLWIVRPLLDLPRSATESYCARHGLTFTRDPHNLDPRRARARVRAALPQLAELLNPRLEQALAGAAALLADEDELVGAIAAARLAEARSGAGFAPGALRDLPPAILRRCVLAAAAEAGVRPERTHLERIAALLRKGSGAVDLPLGRAAVEGGVLRFRAARGAVRPTAPASLAPVAVPGPGRYEWGTAVLEVRPSSDVRKGTMDLQVDAARAPFPWVLRPRRPGDRFRPGGGREKKVADLLIDAGVPRSLRPSLALLQDANGALFFVEHLRAGEAARGEMRHAIALRVRRTGRELDPAKDGLTAVKRAGSPRASMLSHRPDEERR